MANLDRIARAKARAAKGGAPLTPREVQALYAAEPRTPAGDPQSPLARRIQRRLVRPPTVRR